jgi:prepilin-type N-terminal cleavage/methylation domain-containing protein
MKRRGMTLIELLVVVFLVGSICSGVAGVVDREARGCLLPLAAIMAFILVLFIKRCWDSRVAFPRLLRQLDRLNETEGEIGPAIGRLHRLWVSAGALEAALLPRIDLDGQCRAAYLDILGRYVCRRAVKERLMHLAQEPDPLAPRAREILAQSGIGELPK